MLRARPDDRKVLYKNKEELVRLCRKWSRALEYGSDKLLNDADVIIAALDARPDALSVAGPRVRSNRAAVLQIVAKHGPSLAHAAPGLQDDREVVLCAVEQAPSSFSHASPRLREDRQVALAAAARNGALVGSMAAWLRHDAQIVAAALNQLGGRVLELVPERWRGDKAYVLEAVASYGRALGFASPELRNDLQVVLRAMASDPLAYYDASDAMRCDKRVLLASVRRTPATLGHWHPELYDAELALAAVQHGPAGLRYVPDAVSQLEHVALAAVERDVACFRQLPVAARQHTAVALAAVRKECGELEHVPHAFRCVARDVVLAALAGGRRAHDHVPHELRLDKDVARAMVAAAGVALKELPWQLQSDRSIVSDAVSQDGRAFEFAAPQLRSDADILYMALLSWPAAMGYAGAALRSDRGVVLNAVQICGISLLYADAAFRSDEELVRVALVHNHECTHDVTPPPSLVKWLPLEMRDNADLMRTAVLHRESEHPFVSVRLMGIRARNCRSRRARLTLLLCLRRALYPVHALFEAIVLQAGLWETPVWSDAVNRRVFFGGGCNMFAPRPALPTGYTWKHGEPVAADGEDEDDEYDAEDDAEYDDLRWCMSDCVSRDLLCFERRGRVYRYSYGAGGFRETRW